MSKWANDNSTDDDYPNLDEYVDEDVHWTKGYVIPQHLNQHNITSAGLDAYLPDNWWYDVSA